MAIPLPTDDKESKNLLEWDIRLLPGEIITFAARSTSGTVEVTAGMTMREDG